MLEYRLDHSQLDFMQKIHNKDRKKFETEWREALGKGVLSKLVRQWSFGRRETSTYQSRHQ